MHRFHVGMKGGAPADICWPVADLLFGSFFYLFIFFVQPDIFMAYTVFVQFISPRTALPSGLADWYTFLKPASQDWLPKIKTSRDYRNFKQEGAPPSGKGAIVFDGPMLVCTFARKNYIYHCYWLWTSLISLRRVSQGLSQSPLNVFKCSLSMFVEHTVHSVSRVKQQHGSLFPHSLTQSLGCIPKHWLTAAVCFNITLLSWLLFIPLTPADQMV